MKTRKFRAWDKKQKKWLGVNLHMSPLDGFLWWQFGYDCDAMTMEEMENIELVQYIGVRDLNNVEIYEGNILVDDYGRVLLVEQYKFCFCFKAITKTNFKIARDISPWFEKGETFPEIIGHVFENPELVKEAK